MKKYLLLSTITLCVCSSCGSIQKKNISVVDHDPIVVDYDRMVFSNGEYTTFLSRYNFSDTVVQNSVQNGYGLLCGNVFLRVSELWLCGTDSIEKADLRHLSDLPHLLIPSLNIDQIIDEGTFNLIVPTGTYDIVVFADELYPIHLKWEIKSQHKYSFNFYLGCSVLH